MSDWQERIRDVVAEKAELMREVERLIEERPTKIPDGWVLVPKVPTEEMLEALRREASVNGYHSRGGPLCYRALLASAPPPPSTERGG